MASSENTLHGLIVTAREIVCPPGIILVGSKWSVNKKWSFKHVDAP